jgi:hypothetical protein
MNRIPRCGLIRVPADDRQVLLTGTYAVSEPQPTDAMVFGFDDARYLAKVFVDRHDMEVTVVPSDHVPGGYCVCGFHDHGRQWCRDTIVFSLDENH